jgi:hypothetical protein
MISWPVGQGDCALSFSSGWAAVGVALLVLREAQHDLVAVLAFDEEGRAHAHTVGDTGAQGPDHSQWTGLRDLGWVGGEAFFAHQFECRIGIRG